MSSEKITLDEYDTFVTPFTTYAATFNSGLTEQPDTGDYVLGKEAYLEMAKEFDLTEADLELVAEFQDEVCATALNFCENKKAEGKFNSMTVNGIGFTWTNSVDAGSGFTHHYGEAYQDIWEAANKAQEEAST